MSPRASLELKLQRPGEAALFGCSAGEYSECRRCRSQAGDMLLHGGAQDVLNLGARMQRVRHRVAGHSMIDAVEGVCHVL